MRVGGSVGLDFERGVGAGVDIYIGGEVVARIVIFIPKWIYYGPKEGILDYWGILVSWFIILLYPFGG